MARPGLKLALTETTTAAPLVLGVDEDGETPMLCLVGGEGHAASSGSSDGVNLAATFEVSASGTLRTQGFVVNQGGIQAAPVRRPSAMAAAAAASGLSGPGNPTGIGSLSPLENGGASGALSPGGAPAASLHPSDFIELGSVGKGACGVVRRALHTPSLRVVALKEISVYDKDKRRQFVKELTALGSVASPYICGFAGAFFKGASITILLEYANRHSLQEVLKQHGPLPEVLLRRVALHTWRGLQILREQRVVHRDIKPGNLLITNSAQTCITDFGVVTALEGTMDLAGTWERNAATSVCNQAETVVELRSGWLLCSIAIDVLSVCL
jgi:hypothetical protein